MLDFPAELGAAGTPLEAFVRLNTLRGNNGPCLNAGDLEEVVRQRLVDARQFEAKSFRQTLSAGTIVRSEEHTSELQSLMRNSYAVFCLKKKTNDNKHKENHREQ